MKVIHFLLAAPGEAGEETADGLDAILRIAGDADDRFRDLGDAGTGGGGGGGGGDSRITHGKRGKIVRRWKSLGDSTLETRKLLQGNATSEVSFVKPQAHLYRSDEDTEALSFSGFRGFRENLVF